MIVVDTSAWVEYFTAGEGSAADRLTLELQLGRTVLAILPVIAAELLQGFRSDLDFQRALRVVRRLPRLEPGSQIPRGRATPRRPLSTGWRGQQLRDAGPRRGSLRRGIGEECPGVPRTESGLQRT